MNFSKESKSINFRSQQACTMLRNLIIFVLVSLRLEAQEAIYDNFSEWSVYHGDRSGTHYSELDQINVENIDKLELAWTYEGEPIRGRRTIQCNPLIIKDKVYLTTQQLNVVCVDGELGTEKWKWEPRLHGGSGGDVNRGLVYYKNMKGNDFIFFVFGSQLFCIDAESGELVQTFGEKGRVNLRGGLDRDVVGQSVTANTPGIIFENLLIIGSRVGEGPQPAAPGHVRAFNVFTGKREWIFHTIPNPGEFGFDTWPEDAWIRIGGANAWGGMTLDASHGVVYFGTGSASYDHYGGNRKGSNLFANSVVALDASTGKYKWHFQTVHHDLWDYDIPCPPVLTQVKHDGVWIDAAAQVTKVGHLFLFDRQTGKPLFDIEERPVPQSNIPGEFSWPTQPFPVKPPAFAQQRFTAEDVAQVSPDSTEWILEQLKEMETGGVFIPPGFKKSVVLPQFNGGAEWGGAAVDPMTQTLYINASNEAEWISMRSSKPKEEISSYELGKDIYRSICANCHGNSSIASSFEVAPASLEGVSKRLDRKTAVEVIKEGKGAMPAFGLMAQEEQNAIVDFLYKTGKNIKLDVDKIDSQWRDEIPYVATGHHNFRDPNGLPVNKRPWGTLTAINLNSGEFSWQVPLGTYPKLEKQGFPPTGTFNIGGPIVTAGGLVFIGATMDERFRAFDKSTGEVLWEYQLEAGAYSTPATYSIDGRQYVIVAGGGAGKPGTKPGNKYYAFTLNLSE